MKPGVVEGERGFLSPEKGGLRASYANREMPARKLKLTVHILIYLGNCIFKVRDYIIRALSVNALGSCYFIDYLGASEC